jgi:hypothetical protein
MQKRNEQQKELIYKNIEQEKPEFTLKEFASDEEMYFSWYLDELLEAGYTYQWCFEPYTYRLSTIAKYDVKTQLKTRTGVKRLSLLQAHEYTPDFGAPFTPKATGIFYSTLTDGKNLKKTPFVANTDKYGQPYLIAEIKPAYDKHNMIRLFRINQKWMYFQNKVYVQEIVVDTKNERGLFAKTFTPAKYLLTPTGKQRTLHYTPRTLQEFISL